MAGNEDWGASRQSGGDGTGGGGHGDNQATRVSGRFVQCCECVSARTHKRGEGKGKGRAGRSTAHAVGGRRRRRGDGRGSRAQRIGQTGAVEVVWSWRAWGTKVVWRAKTAKLPCSLKGS